MACAVAAGQLEKADTARKLAGIFFDLFLDFY
jgi:hypothetical protein